jgi:PEP-CTERM motif
VNNLTATSSSFSSSAILNVQTNTAYLGNLVASDAFAPGISSFAGSTVDPSITLGTTDPAYNLEFSPGLVGPRPTPEPASLALLGTAVAPLAALRRRFTPTCA